MTFKSGKIMNFKLGKSPLALAIVAAMLVGCGGGGSSSKPSTSTPPTNPTTPTDPTDPTTPTDPTDPTKPVEKEPSVVDTNTTVAKVKVGVLDTGVVETESLKGSISSIKSIHLILQPAKLLSLIYLMLLLICRTMAIASMARLYQL